MSVSDSRFSKRSHLTQIVTSPPSLQWPIPPFPPPLSTSRIPTFSTVVGLTSASVKTKATGLSAIGPFVSDLSAPSTANFDNSLRLPPGNTNSPVVAASLRPRTSSLAPQFVTDGTAASPAPVPTLVPPLSTLRKAPQSHLEKKLGVFSDPPSSTKAFGVSGHGPFKINRWLASITDTLSSKPLVGASAARHNQSAERATANLDNDSWPLVAPDFRSTPNHKRTVYVSPVHELETATKTDPTNRFGDPPNLGPNSVLFVPPIDLVHKHHNSWVQNSSDEHRRGASDSCSENHPPSTQAMRSGSSNSTFRNQNGQDQYASRGPSRTRDGSNSRGSKPPSQKAMLSKALQKANTAVQLDNAQNFEGARLAYIEACDLLKHVLSKTAQEEDKRKLEAIRRTYISRIEELDLMELQPANTDSKALPARPDSDSYSTSSAIYGEPVKFDMEQPRKHTQTLTRIVRGEGRSPNPGGLAPSPRLQTNGAFLSSQGYGGSGRSPLSASSAQSGESDQLGISSLVDQLNLAPSSLSRSAIPRKPFEGSKDLPHAAQVTSQTYRRESPQRLRNPGLNDSFGSDYSQASEAHTDSKQARGHARVGSQNSWLEPINESKGSRGSSVHSRTSSHGYRRRHLRGRSGDTENEFDTALDEAIEAAYDDGFEPADSDNYHNDEPEDDIVAAALRKVEMARQRVRQTEQEAFEMLTQQNDQRLQRANARARGMGEDFFDDSSSGDEEHILEQMNRSQNVEDYTLNQQPKPQIPRESDSSGTTSRTYHSSFGSNPVTGNTSLSTVTESSPYHTDSKQIAPPPMQSLPEIPTKRGASAQSVRSRRLSSQNPKQLKIQTVKLSPSKAKPNVDATGAITSAPVQDHDAEPVSSDTPWSDGGLRRPLSPPEEPSSAEPRRIESPLNRRRLLQDEDDQTERSASPTTHRVRKNFSSSSLRSMKARNMSLSNLDETSDISPATSFGALPISSRAPAVPALPTSATLRERMEASATGGFYLFDDEFHSKDEPDSPTSVMDDIPVSLEPCPQDIMLRPFWLMRCLYQTLANPRGGYLSTKLFVPREVWGVKGVKLKNVDDKIANCDFLTAALLKLATVDTYDADAVLEEMQALEGVLEQAQAALARKLGSEVGVQGSSTLFKDASNLTEGDATSAVPRSGSVSTKSSSFSWRRLRTQKSAASLGGSYNIKISGAETKDNLSIPSLPMTPVPTSKPARRELGQVQFTGPNAHYMGSLARLFDAAQVLDQIARQVDDPGLRHADKTQVGLELCTRHAAEFFGFYVCRFVLTDISLLLDKFIKRASEWVIT